MIEPVYFLQTAIIKPISISSLALQSNTGGEKPGADNLSGPLDGGDNAYRTQEHCFLYPCTKGLRRLSAWNVVQGGLALAAVPGCGISNPATWLKGLSKVHSTGSDFGRYAHHIQSLANRRENLNIDLRIGARPYRL